MFTACLLALSGTKNATSDEPPHLAAGLSYLATGTIRINTQHPPLLKELSALSLMAGGIRWPDSAEARAVPITGDDQLSWSIGKAIVASDPDKVIFLARVPMIAIAVMLGVLIFAWGRQLAGEDAALGALFLYIVNPHFLGHGYLVTMDCGFAAFTLLFLYTLWNYTQKASRVWLAAAGVSLGLAMCAKFSGVALIPIAAILLLATNWRRGVDSVPQTKTGRRVKPPAPDQPKKGLQWLPALRDFAILMALAVIVIHAIYLFPRDPLSYVNGYRQVYADHNPNYQFYFMGEFGPQNPLYFAGAYLLKEPLAGVFLACLGLYLFVRSTRMEPLAKLFVAIPAVILFVGYSISAKNLGIRYIIPVLPFLFLAGGMALASLFQSSNGRKIAAVLCAWLIIAAVAIYPDHISYFNEAACLRAPEKLGLDGGTACGPDLLNDSNVDWGGSLKQLKSWLDENQKGRHTVFSHFTTMPPETYGIRYANLDPRDPTISRRPALYIISAHLLSWARQSGAEWLKQKPSAIVGHSYYIFELN